ncbi:MAG: hypothetical protein IT326_09875 [Anaerolineae bacterium]|nr:hypothetical protein [Anaerolineae bacterium]
MDELRGRVLEILYLYELLERDEKINSVDQFGVRVNNWINERHHERKTDEQMEDILQTGMEKGYLVRDGKRAVSLTGTGLALARQNLNRAGLLH